MPTGAIAIAVGYGRRATFGWLMEFAGVAGLVRGCIVFQRLHLWLFGLGVRCFDRSSDLGRDAGILSLGKRRGLVIRTIVVSVFVRLVVRMRIGVRIRRLRVVCVLRVARVHLVVMREPGRGLLR